jgi:hypothetical protein
MDELEIGKLFQEHYDLIRSVRIQMLQESEKLINESKNTLSSHIKSLSVHHKIYIDNEITSLFKNLVWNEIDKHLQNEIKKSITILHKKYLKEIITLINKNNNKNTVPKGEKTQEEWLNTPLEDLSISRRTFNILKLKGVHLVKDLQDINLYAIRGIGARGRAKIRENITGSSITI